jgi:putative ABC transport system permease protein
VADLQFALRTAVKSPGFSNVVVLTLALGIGATTAIFSVVNGVLLRPLPYEDPDELIYIQEQMEGFGGMSVSYPDFLDWREQNTVFEGIAVFRGLEANLTSGGDPIEISGSIVSADLFPLLGVKPVLGRTFTREEDQIGAPLGTVLSYSFWRERFGADPDVVGRALLIDDLPCTVLGVMPEGFTFPRLSGSPDLWGPVGPFSEGWLESRGNHPGLTAVARLKPGVTLERARADMAAISLRLGEEYPDTNEGVEAWVRPMREVVLGRHSEVLMLLFAGVALVLLIACGNVANLLLTRGTVRHQEMAIRAALGASRGRIARLVLAESMVFWLAGGLTGLLVASWGTTLLGRWLTTLLPRAESVVVDAKVLLFALAISLITGVVFGLVPARRSAPLALLESLKEGGRTTNLAARHRTRRQLIIGELALAQTLLIVAGLVIHSFSLLLTADPGFETQNLLTARISLPEERYPELAQRDAFFHQLLERVRAHPATVSAAVGGPIPLDPKSGWQTGYYVEGDPLPEPSDAQFTEVFAVGDDYFGTMQIPLIRGRYLTREDGTAATVNVVVDLAFAERHWPGQDPIGKRFAFGAPDSLEELQGEDWEWMEIVGVVGPVKDRGIAEDTLVQAYMPFEQDNDHSWSLVLRTAGDPMELAEPVRQLVLELDPNLPVADIVPMQQYLDDTTVSSRVLSTLLGAFAAAALLLAAVGVYGVISHDAAARSHEIGVRMAVGASSGEVLRMVLRQSLLMVGAGILIGMALALLAGRWLSSELYGVGPADPLTLIGAPLFLCAVAVIATLLPARRAARVDPLIALRAE